MTDREHARLDRVQFGAGPGLADEVVGTRELHLDLSTNRRQGASILQQHSAHVVGEELELCGEAGVHQGTAALASGDVESEASCRARQERQPDHGGGPGQQAVENLVGLPLPGLIERTRHPEDGSLVGLAVDATDQLAGPLPIEAEVTGGAEELGSITDREDRLDPHAEPTDLPAALAGHSHPQDGLGALRGDRRSLIGAVQVVLGEHHLDLAARLQADLVRRVLDQLEQLPVAVPARRDATFTVRMLLDQPGVDPIRFENALGLGLNESQDLVGTAGGTGGRLHGDFQLLDI